jgi:hypothetical protein
MTHPATNTIAREAGQGTLAIYNGPKEEFRKAIHLIHQAFRWNALAHLEYIFYQRDVPMEHSTKS